MGESPIGVTVTPHVWVPEIVAGYQYEEKQRENMLLILLRSRNEEATPATGAGLPSFKRVCSSLLPFWAPLSHVICLSHVRRVADPNRLPAERRMFFRCWQCETSAD